MEIMKKTALSILIILALALLAGCGEEKIADKIGADEQEKRDIYPATVEEQIIKPDIINHEENAEIPAEPDETAGEIEELLQEKLTDINKAIPQKIRELIDKSETITNYQYFFGNDEYFVKDDVIHIIFNENKGDLLDDTLYNNVMIDRSKKKAYVWCTDKTYCGPNKPKLYWEVNYSEYNFMTPTQLLQSLSNAKIINEETTCERKKCTEIESKDDADGITKNIWIFTYNPAVWKVQWYDASKGKEFIDLYQNTVFFRVNNEDVMIPEDYELTTK